MRSISVSQAQSFDRFAQEKLGIPSLILMENAGRHVAEEVLKMLRATGCGGRVAVVCGVGNNGGDGLVAARHLFNAGVKVEVFIVGKLSKIKSDPKINYNILRKMGVKPATISSRLPNKETAKFIRRFPKTKIIVDAIFGIGLRSQVREPYASVIKTLNDSGKPVLSVDVPSGLDADTGRVLGIAVKAKKTITFVAAKKGFFMESGPAYCGKIIVRDIGVI